MNNTVVTQNALPAGVQLRGLIRELRCLGGLGGPNVSTSGAVGSEDRRKDSQPQLPYFKLWEAPEPQSLEAGQEEHRYSAILLLVLRRIEEPCCWSLHGLASVRALKFAGWIGALGRHVLHVGLRVYIPIGWIIVSICRLYLGS